MTGTSSISRRGFLRASGVAALAGALPACVGDTVGESGSDLVFDNERLTRRWEYFWKVPELFFQRSRPPSYTPAIVIGSGFGGAVAALRLAQAGIETTVLERGLRWPSHPMRQIFSSETRIDGRAYWHRTSAPLQTGGTASFDDFAGVFDITEYENMAVWRGACVGGGSVIYAGATVQPERAYFDALFRGVASYDELDRVYFPRARTMLGVSPIPDDILGAGPFGYVRVWEEQARAAGYSPVRHPSIFDWSVVRDELAEASRASATVGESQYGNSNGAKIDLSQTYLLLAEETGRAKIYPSQKVLGISRDWLGRYLVDLVSLDPWGEEIASSTIACRHLFLAAGSIGTSELLVRARATRELPRLNEHVGEGWGSNGDAACARAFGPIRGWYQAAPDVMTIHDASGATPVTMQNFHTPNLSLNLGVVGSVAMTLDLSNRGSFAYDSATDDVKLRWDARGNDEPVAATREVHDRIAEANDIGVGAGPAPDVGAGFTAHPLGGAVLGLATDAYGRVAGYDRLYVVDGALIPGNCAAVNPSLTITALAERNVERVIQEDF